MSSSIQPSCLPLLGDDLPKQIIRYSLGPGGFKYEGTFVLTSSLKETARKVELLSPKGMAASQTLLSLNKKNQK